MSIGGQLASRPFKNDLSNCGIVATVLMTLMRWDSLIDDDRFRCRSRR
jgi:hypothetical protein